MGPSGAGPLLPEQGLVGLESKTNAWPAAEVLRSWRHTLLEPGSIKMDIIFKEQKGVLGKKRDPSRHRHRHS